MDILQHPESLFTCCKWYINYILTCTPCRQYLPLTTVPSTQHPSYTVNTMLNKTIIIQMTKSYSSITDYEQYYTHPVDMDIMKCLISKGLYCSLSVGLYPVQEYRNCAISLYFNKYNAIKSYYSITVNTITKNSVTQLSPKMSNFSNQTKSHRV